MAAQVEPVRSVSGGNPMKPFGLQTTRAIECNHGHGSSKVFFLSRTVRGRPIWLLIVTVFPHYIDQEQGTYVPARPHPCPGRAVSTWGTFVVEPTRHYLGWRL